MSPFPKRRSNSANTGTAWETEIQRTCDEYERQGLARIRKVTPPTRTIGKGQVIYMANPFVDFIGCLKGGRMVALEAKSTSTPRLPIGGDSGLTGKQIEALLKWESMGAAVGVLWQLSGLISFRMGFVHMGLIKHAMVHGEKSLKFEETHSVTPGEEFCTVDFLRYLI